MFGHFIRPATPGFTLLTATIGLVSSGTDPCVPEDSCVLAVSWTHSGAGTVTVQSGTSASGPWTDLVTGLSAAVGHYDHQADGFIITGGLPNHTFYYRVVNEATPSNTVQDQSDRRVTTCA